MDSKWNQTRILTGESFGPDGYTYTTYNSESLDRLKLATKALEQLLTRAQKRDLPALPWRVDEFAISAAATLGDAMPPAEKRARFMAWAEALDAEWRERKYNAPGGPAIELLGNAKIPAPARPHLTVSIGLHVEWWVSDETNEGDKPE